VGDGSRVEPEGGAVTGTDLNDLPVQPGQEAAPVFSAPAAVHPLDGTGVGTGKAWVLQSRRSAPAALLFHQGASAEMEPRGTRGNVNLI
jgi:hypothetical protein